MLCKDKLNPKYVPNKKAFILSLFVGFNTQLWGYSAFSLLFGRLEGEFWG